MLEVSEVHVRVRLCKIAGTLSSIEGWAELITLCLVACGKDPETLVADFAFWSNSAAHL